MLWTDRRIFLTLEQLTALDQEVPKIASSQSIVTDGENGIIAQGIAEAAQALRSVTQAFVNGPPGSIIPIGHLAAIFGSWGNIPRVPLNQVVINSPIPGEWGIVSRWVGYHTLLLFYREAAERATVDRYQAKYDRIHSQLIHRYTPDLYTQGLPIVLTPLAAPAGEREISPGTWDASDLGSAAGGADPGGVYDVAITYTGSAYVDQVNWTNNESAPSVKAAVTLPPSTYLTVSIARLKAPTGIQPQQTIALGMYAPMPASGWNIWAGRRNGTLYLQNPQPIPIAQTSYQFAQAPVLSGAALHAGQTPDGSLTINYTLMRG